MLLIIWNSQRRFWSCIRCSIKLMLRYISIWFYIWITFSIKVFHICLYQILIYLIPLNHMQKTRSSKIITVHSTIYFMKSKQQLQFVFLFCGIKVITPLFGGINRNEAKCSYVLIFKFLTVVSYLLLLLTCKYCKILKNWHKANYRTNW